MAYARLHVVIHGRIEMKARAWYTYGRCQLVRAAAIDVVMKKRHRGVGVTLARRWRR